MESLGLNLEMHNIFPEFQLKKRRGVRIPFNKHPFEEKKKATDLVEWPEDQGFG